VAEGLGSQKLGLWAAFDLVIDRPNSPRSSRDSIDSLQFLLNWLSSDCDSEQIQRSVFPPQVEDHGPVYTSFLKQCCCEEFVVPSVGLHSDWFAGYSSTSGWCW
jgi:hypothetical protein